MRIRIPGIVDLVIVSDRATIASAAQSTLLDRKFEPVGPLVNRLLAGRVCRALAVKGIRLPSILPRWDSERAELQSALQSRLDTLAEDRVADNETLRALADAIKDESGAAAIPIAAQQAVGRWFVADYRANGQSWQAACELHAAVSSKNIPYVVYLFLSGKVSAAQRLLAERARGDRTAVHATAVAVHNLVRGFEAMQQVWRDPYLRMGLSDDAVLGRCLFAPENVLRQASASGPSAAGDVNPGTLVVLSLEAARVRAPGHDITFLSQAWSHCPAGKAVVALLRAVWRELKAGRGHG